MVYITSNTSSKSKQNNTQKINLKQNKETIEIARKIHINYNYCHHCKQRKPGEVTLQCKSRLNNGKGSTRPHKAFIINNTTVVRSNYNSPNHIIIFIESKCLIIKHFEGDPKEFIESTEKVEVPRECGRFFCHFCLKGSYDAIVDEVKVKRDWMCPYCTGVCFCSRCTRYDKILKLIGLYVSLGGELNALYDSLIMKSDILDRLNVHMLISNLVVVINDPSLKPMQIMKNIAKVEVKSMKKIDGMISKCDSYKDNISGIQSYYDKVFMRSRIDKCLLFYDKYISDMCFNSKDDSEFLKKKKKRNKKNNVINIAQSYWKKGKYAKKRRHKKRESDEDNDEEEGEADEDEEDVDDVDIDDVDVDEKDVDEKDIDEEDVDDEDVNDEAVENLEDNVDEKIQDDEDEVINEDLNEEEDYDDDFSEDSYYEEEEESYEVSEESYDEEEESYTNKSYKKKKKKAMTKRTTSKTTKSKTDPKAKQKGKKQTNEEDIVPKRKRGRPRKNP